MHRAILGNLRGCTLKFGMTATPISAFWLIPSAVPPGADAQDGGADSPNLTRLEHWKDHQLQISSSARNRNTL